MKIASATFCLTVLAGVSSLAFATEAVGTAGLATTVQATAMTDAQIQRRLQANGYTNVQVTDHDKDHIDVRATNDGKTEKLGINSQTGAAMPDTDDDDD